MIVIGHIGHWYHAVLYLVPIALVGLGLWVAGRHLPDDPEQDVFEDDPDDIGDGGPGLDVRSGT